MQQLLSALPALPPGGRRHLVLGQPYSDLADKTLVEPGNRFSPGVATCGLSVWVEVDGRLFAPETTPDDQVTWAFDAPHGAPGVLRSTWPTGDHLRVVSRLAQLAGRHLRSHDLLEVTVAAQAAVTANLYIVVRDVGPAGGPVEAFEWDADARTLTVRPEPPSEAVTPVQIVAEPAPEQVTVEAPTATRGPVAVLCWPINLAADERRTVVVRAWHAALRTPGAPVGTAPVDVLPATKVFAEAEHRWSHAHVRLVAPDPRIARAWQHALFHITAAMECGLPRIATLDYPALWVRGGASIARALDLAGFRELARTGLEALAPLTFAGPFGAEADLPSIGVWALVSHARLANDENWLRRLMPYITRRISSLEGMLKAANPVHVSGDNRVPAFAHDPLANLLCWPAEHGLIRGRAGAAGAFYVNAWAAAAFQLAAAAARKVAKGPQADRWELLGRELELAITEHLLPDFAALDEMDACAAPHPADILYANRLGLRRRFEAWFRANRLDDAGQPIHDPRYPYIELTQLHNAVLLGLKDLAWPHLDQLLGPPPDADGRTAIRLWSEGEAGGPECLPFGRPAGLRGWLDPQHADAANMPNNWAAAELVQLLRSLFVTECDQRLILGQGVPDAWLKPGCEFGVYNLPTALGTISYLARVQDDGRVKLDFKGPHKWQAAFPIVPRPITRRAGP